MEIDGRLISFKEKVGANLSKLNTSKSELTKDMTQTVTINTNVIDQLNSTFKSDGAATAVKQIEDLNQTMTKLTQSVETEIGGMITKCQTLNSGIGELEGIVSSYNSKVSELNRLDKEDSKRSSIQSEINKLKSDFETKHAELIKLHDEITGVETTGIDVEENPPEGNNPIDLGGGITLEYDDSDMSVNIYYESNGVIYQKVLPVVVNGGLAATYTIAYDKNAILNAVGQDSEMGQKAIAFLNSKLTSNEQKGALWKMFDRSYSSEQYNDIAKIMDVVLDSSYKANNCQTITDYATVAATVATNSLVHMKYDGARTSYTKGFGQVLRSGYDCIGFTNWAYYQGLANVYKLPDNADVALKEVTCNGVYWYYGNDIEDMSLSERANIKPGSIVTRHGHIGMVIGTTTDSNGTTKVVIAHSAGTGQGTITGAWPIDKLTNQWQRVTTPEEMTKLALEGDYKNK